MCCLVRTTTREIRAGRSTASIRASLSPESSKSSPRRAVCSSRTPAYGTAVRPLTQLPFGLPSAPAPFSYSYPLSRAVAANPSDSDRVGCVVRYDQAFSAPEVRLGACKRGPQVRAVVAEQQRWADEPQAHAASRAARDVRCPAPGCQAAVPTRDRGHGGRDGTLPNATLLISTFPEDFFGYHFLQ